MQKGQPGMGFKSMLRALRHRNFRLFFMGQSISLIGTWMQRLALGWLVYRLTKSAFLLGLVGFANQIPLFFLAPFAGVLADRQNRQRLLLFTQVLAMVQAFILSLLVLTEQITIWQIIGLSLFLGFINAFDMPTRQSFLVEMIADKRDLGNAIALNSSMVNAARLVGPASAGILIGLVGEGFCFLINGVSYLAVIFSLLIMKIVPKQKSVAKTNIWQELRAGLSYVSAFEPIWATLLLLSLVSLMALPYAVLMPVFARDVLHGGPQLLGFLMGAAGVGALLGALYLASKRTVIGLDRLIPLATLVLGAGLMAFSFSRLYWLSFSLMLLIGIGQMIQMASSNTLIQTIVADDMRGRIMSFYGVAFMGVQPVGSLFAGFLANKIGATRAVFIGGLVCLIGALFFFRRQTAIREKIKPLYQKLGIIPPIPPSFQNTTELSLPNRFSK